MERARWVGHEGRELLRDIVLANAGGEFIGAGRPGLIVGPRGLVREQAKPGCFEDYEVESADHVKAWDDLEKCAVWTGGQKNGAYRELEDREHQWLLRQ